MKNTSTAKTILVRAALASVFSLVGSGVATAASGTVNKGEANLTVTAPGSKEGHVSPALQGQKDRCLWEAAFDGGIETVERLLSSGADVHADNDGALRIAALRGHTGVVKALLQAGADVHADNDDAIVRAVLMMHTATALVLLDAGAVNNEALRHAAFLGLAPVVKKLLDAGANAYASDLPNWWHAIGNREVVALLAPVFQEKRLVPFRSRGPAACEP